MCVCVHVCVHVKSLSISVEKRTVHALIHQCCCCCCMSCEVEAGAEAMAEGRLFLYALTTESSTSLSTLWGTKLEQDSTYMHACTQEEHTQNVKLSLSRQCWLTIHVVFESRSFNNSIIIFRYVFKILVASSLFSVVIINF